MNYDTLLKWPSQQNVKCKYEITLKLFTRMQECWFYDMHLFLDKSMKISRLKVVFIPKLAFKVSKYARRNTDGMYEKIEFFWRLFLLARSIPWVVTFRAINYLMPMLVIFSKGNLVLFYILSWYFFRFETATSCQM